MAQHDISDILHRRIDLSDVSSDQAVEFLETWHANAGSEMIEIFLLPMGRSIFSSLSDAIGILNRDGGEGLRDLIYFDSDDGKAQNVYVGVSTVPSTEMVHIGRGRRGKAEQRGLCGGAWVDADVKDGAFSGWDAVMDWVWELDRLGVGPTMTVSTGSGGAHLYFGQDGGISSQLGSELSQRLRLWAREEHGLVLDNVAQRNRVLRLPGTIRAPGKKDDPRVGAMIELRRSEKSRDDIAEHIIAVTDDVWSELRAKARVTREQLDIDISHVGIALGASRWHRALAVESFERDFAKSVSWSQILEGKGWARYGSPDDEGRQSWTRPGPGPKNPRSAITGWRESPNVMSLLSDSEETGLRRLYLLGELGTRRVPLTKARVASELWFDGSMEMLVNYWLSKLVK